jgi:hypothetical protein
MSEQIQTSTDTEPENEQYPIEPRYHPIHKIPRKIYDILASSRLAMALLVAILASCVAGVTVLRGDPWRLIFTTLWFNGLLILLVVNVACCFFGRIWRRRVTLVSFGMILFHVSFVAVFLGIVYNSLFFFRGVIRLTEGEVLKSDDPQSYDVFETGRFFTFSRIRGETSLIKMHRDYKVQGDDKRAAYEIAVGEGTNRKQGIVYITHKLTHNGFDYFNDREGYSLLLVLADRQGRELYGAHIPLQSIKQGEAYLYSTGHQADGKVIKSPIQFPAPTEIMLFGLQVEYIPSKLKDRDGEARFMIYPLDLKGNPLLEKPLAEGKRAIGQPFTIGEYILTAKEVRYWVGMTVRHEPGKPIVLTSLWVGLAGMIITLIGRMMRGRPSTAA